MIKSAPSDKQPKAIKKQQKQLKAAKSSQKQQQIIKKHQKAINLIKSISIYIQKPFRGIYAATKDELYLQRSGSGAKRPKK